MSVEGVVVRRDGDRGRFVNEWLDARFSFSFGDWRDPDWPAFGPLRALNEDRVQPGTGFAMHPHRDLEILMLPRAGRIAHRDDAGGEAEVRPGELHFMRAGRGIRHSQTNPCREEVDHHFQIWIAPRTRGLAPHVQTLPVAAPGRDGWAVLASPGGQGGGAPLDADATLILGRPGPDRPLALSGRPGRRRYLHVMAGTVRIEGIVLRSGDAWAEHEASAPRTVEAEGDAELLGFDLPRD